MTHTETLIQNINPAFGMGATFEGATEQEAVAAMGGAIRERGFEPGDLLLGRDYVIL